MLSANFQRLIVSAILIVTLLSGQLTSADADDSDIINPSWVKPGYRFRSTAEVPNTVEPQQQCQCPKEPSSKQTPLNAAEEDNRLALVFFRKFLIRLFDDSKLVVDDQNNAFKLRNVQLKITERQLKSIKEATNARDMDAVVTSIVEQSEGSIYRATAENLCWNLVTWYGSAVNSPVFLYVAVPATIIILVFVIGRLLGISLWILIPALCLVITYVLTYRDCNNRLELESLTKLMNTDGSNPCGKYRGRSAWWFQRMVQKDNEAQCIDHIREQYGLKRSFCDPSEVFVEMMAKLHLQYFETFVLKMVSVFKVSTASSGLVETVLISGFILFVLYLLLTVGLKYGLYASGRFFADVITRPRTGGNQTVDQGNTRQESERLPPTAPFNINVNITRTRRTNSRVEAITNRIEDIAEGGGGGAVAREPKVTGAMEPASVEETSRRKEDGSGDGPPDAAVKKDESTEESQSSDEEMVVIHGEFTDDVRKDTVAGLTDNQSKTDVEQ